MDAACHDNGPGSSDLNECMWCMYLAPVYVLVLVPSVTMPA